MAVTAFSRSVQVFVDQNLSGEAQSAQLAAVARAGVADLVASGQASDRYETFVDGAEGAPEESVKPLGTIIYLFEYLGDVVTFALGFLVGRSPVRTGRYSESFYVSTDSGPGISADQFDPTTMDVGSQIIIYNIQPYNRKVDVQLIGQTRMSFSVPPGIWDDCAQAIKARFGNTVRATRISDVDFPGKYTLRNRQIHRTTGRVVRGVGEPTTSPGLMITALGVG